MYYRYKGAEIMINNLYDLLMYSNNITILNICAYKVNTEGKYPFQEFLMVKNPNAHSNEFIFPFMYLDNEIINKTDINNEISYKTSYILTHLIHFDYMKDVIHIDGYFEYKKELYVFIDITQQFKSNICGEFVLVDELLNTRKMNETPIQYQANVLFEMNEKLCFLLDDKDEFYEIPSVAYVYKDKTKVNFTSVFGETSTFGIMGNYFYFTNYKNALSKKPNGGGIIRFALFTGNTKYVENLPNDPVDVSDVKKERMRDSNLDENYEKMTLRITDYDGLWANNYDSVYLGKIELDNGDFVKDTPILVIREHCQQIPLSIH
jgi:hypothetical protein